MKTQAKPERRAQRTVHKPAKRRPAAWWIYALAALAAYICAYLVYSPSLDGQFVFDDLHLPFTQPAAVLWPLKEWLHVRPLTMFTYWVNLHLSGLRTTPYHQWNIVFHTAASFLGFFVFRKLLELARTAEPNRTILAIFGAAVFLLHPIQTEGVAYVAGRSENLSAVFFFAAWAVFLYRRQEAISWPAVVAIVALFIAAVASKEHTPTLIGVLLATDYFFNPGFSWKGAKRNWRLYGPILAAGIAGAIAIIGYIRTDTTSIGFHLEGLPWYQYLFTQFRVFYVYLGLFLFPYWQSIDYDFPVSHTLVEHGAVFYLAGILAMAGAAFHYRRRFPLAAYGFFVFCLILSPTSTFIPLKDVIADRRLYLPIVGLILIALEFLRRWKADRKVLAGTLAVVCLVFAIWTYNRSKVWSGAVTLWQDAVDKAPQKQRVQFGVGVAYFQANRCKEAVEHFARASVLEKPDYQVMMDWGMALECLNEHEHAIAMLKRSIEMHPSAQAWANIALVELKQGQIENPLVALDNAQALDASFVSTYLYRGSLYMALRQYDRAAANFQHALALDSTNPMAIELMSKLQAEMSAPAR